MIDKTPVAVAQHNAYKTIAFARELYSSGSEKKRLQANLHYKNAMYAAQKALEKNCDPSVVSDMTQIIEECQCRLPQDLDGFIEISWNDYKCRVRRIYHALFGEPIMEKADSAIEFFRQDLTRLQRLYEKFPTEYGFLTQDKLIAFFHNPESIYNNGNLWDACYGTCACYTDPVLELEIMFREYLEYRFYKTEVEGAPKPRFGEVWSEMRQKYLGGKEYVQTDEMIADGRLQQFSVEEIMSALYFCIVYKERYCEGYFLSCCEDGIIGKLLFHLKNIDNRDYCAHENR